MSEQDTVKIVEQAYKNFQTGDINALLGLMSEDIEWQLPEIEGISFTGARRGRASVAEFFAAIDDQQEVLEFAPAEFIAQGDKVAVQGHYRWRVKATSREYGSDWLHVFTVRGGQVVGFKEYLDTAVAASAYQKAQSA